LDCAEARERLLQGNKRFANATPSSPLQEIVSIDLGGLGIDENADVPRQQPFAAVLSCSDARVPVEMIFRQACNDPFVVRLAGNVMSDEGVGSLGFAVKHLDGSVKLIVVLGHSCCGAVGAAVDAHLSLASYAETASEVGLRSIIDRILVSVRTGAQALERAGITKASGESLYGQRLLEMSVVLSAAMTAMSLQQTMSAAAPAGCPIVYGIYDLASRLVRAPLLEAEAPAQLQPHLADPPTSIGEFESLADLLVKSGEA
jgi:carbonic anhydrase